MEEFPVTRFLSWRDALDFALFYAEMLDEKQRVYRDVVPGGRWAVVDVRAFAEPTA